MMKIERVLLFFVTIFASSFMLCAPCNNHCGVQETGKTTLANGQVPFSSVSPELVAGFGYDRMYARKNIRHAAIQWALFGGHSTHSSKKDLARYFFPQGKLCLRSVDDDLVDNFDKEKDLLAQNFNVFTKNGSFKSDISIAPEQSIVGFGFQWQQSFIRDPLKGHGIWASVSVPLLQVRNRINFQENVIDNGGGPDESAGVPVVGTMKEAFVQEAWFFGKMNDCVMKKTALADIELKIGYDHYLSDEPSYAALYAGIIIPTGNKHKGEFVFEPIVGRGKHVGIMFGGELSKAIVEGYDFDNKCLWKVALHSEYLFKNKQIRSFDLLDKPWSRYIPLYADKEQAQEAADLIVVDPNRANNLATPGINILTQQVSVIPGFSGDLNTAFVFEHLRMRAELGYNLFLKRAESVCLACPWKAVSAIKYVSGEGETNPIRDITGNKYLEQEVINNSGVVLIPVDLDHFDQSLITEKDLDLLSATTPALISHTVYIALGGCFDEREYPCMVNGGFLYTFSQNNAVINKWMMWLKGGVSF